MSKRDYLSYIDNNHIKVDIEKVPETAFIKANKVLDICVATVLDRRHNSKLERGGPDVLIQSISGERFMLTRKELCKKFRHISGKQIHLAYLKNNKAYPVYRELTEADSAFRVMKTSKKYLGHLRGRMIPLESYVVCREDGNGALLKETMTVVSPKVFRKMFKIPMQEIIRRNMSDAKKKVKQIPSSVMSEPIVTDNGLRMGVTSQIPKPIDVNDLREKTMVQGQMVNEHRYPYKATHRIVNMSNHNIVGFVIKEVSTGTSKQLSLESVKRLCKQRKIENIMLVVKEGTNLEFLRGNGIKLENLPEIIM